MLASDEEGGTLDALRFSLASDIVELVVLTTDEPFLQTLREAVGGARRLWHVPSADKVGDLLLAGEVGILVLDVQTLNEAPGIFVGQIKRQFPDLVVVVAGNRDAEISLAGLISAGVVYRFIHKPMSPGRAKLFADAAVKKYDDQRRRAIPPPVKHGARLPVRLLTACAAGVLAGVVAAAWLMHRGTQSEPAHMGTGTLAAHPPAAHPPAAHPPAAESAPLEERLDEASAAIESARKSGVERGRIASLNAPATKSREQAKTAQTAAQAAAPAAQTAERARGAPMAEEDQVTPLPAPAAPRLADSHLIDPEADSDAKAQPLKNAMVTSPESSSAPHDLDAAVAERQFLANIVTAGDLKLIKSVEPVYPRKAELNKTEGWVELDFTVAESGAVKDIAVHAASAPGVFEDAAIGALAKWRYQPVLRDGKPAAQRARIRIRFKLVD